MIRRQDNDRFASWQSWQNQQVQAQKNTGSKNNPRYESIYDNFNDFYDEQKMFNAIFDPERVKEQIEKERPMTLADKNRWLSQIEGRK